MQKMPESPLAEMISKRGMTREQAFNASGLSRSTFDILMGGGVTLPQLALKIGKGLRLNQDEVKQLGKPLNKETWEAQKLPYKSIDVDPHWYRQIGKKLDKSLDAYEMYLDKAALVQELLARGMDYSTFFNAHPEVGNVNRGTPERRRKLIAYIAELLGVEPSKLETPHYYHGNVEQRFLIRKDDLEKAMQLRGMDRVELAKATWTPEDATKTPTRRMVKMWQTIEDGDTVTVWLAEKIAEVLGVEVIDFADVRMEQR